MDTNEAMQPATTADVEQAIDKLALMINEGFTHTASKEDIKALEERVNTRFDSIDSRLDNIENLLLAKQEQRLNELEARMRKLEDALAV